LGSGAKERLGVAGFHSHKERPAFAYILQGRLTELRQGGYEKTLGPGGIITESRDVDHWDRLTWTNLAGMSAD